jgi:hypothetical protein
MLDLVFFIRSDPESSTEFSHVLYNNDDFMLSLSNSLRADAILVSQLGENVGYASAGTYSPSKLIENEFIKNLIDHGFDRIEDYSESHGGFLANWHYKIIFKCSICTYRRWHNNPALIDVEMKKRSMKSVTDQPLFRYFDGATMMGYQYPSRVNEIVFCRDASQHQDENDILSCQSGHGYNPELYNIPLQDELTALNHSTNTHIVDSGGTVAHSGTQLAALSTNHSFISFDAITQSVIVMPTATNVIEEVMLESTMDHDIVNRWSFWGTILNKYTSRCSYWGPSCVYVNLYGLIFDQNTEFVNHKLSEVIRNVTSSVGSVVYNPYISRNHLNIQRTVDRTLIMMLTTTATYLRNVTDEINYG